MRNVLRVSESDLLSSMSINEGVSESSKSYHEVVRRNGCLARGDVFIIKTLVGNTSEATYSFGRSNAMVWE